MSKIILENARLIDATHSKPSEPCSVIIEEDLIKEITHQTCTNANFQRINLKGHYLLPGLIDNHVHVSASKFDLADTDIPESYRSLQAKVYLENMLQRGFTSVRDAGGADHGLALATERQQTS